MKQYRCHTKQYRCYTKLITISKDGVTYSDFITLPGGMELAISGTVEMLGRQCEFFPTGMRVAAVDRLGRIREALHIPDITLRELSGIIGNSIKK